MTDWKKYLLTMAEKSQMCKPFRDSLVQCEDKASAVKLYHRNITWACENNYPPLDVIRGEFSSFRAMGLFVDCVFTGQLFKLQQSYALHHCKGLITVDIDFENANIPMLYVANDCDLIVERAKGEDELPIVVPIYIFGNSKVVAKDTDRVHFRIYHKQVKGL